jgi:transposase
VSDELWERVEPLLPVKERRFRYPGRNRLPDRQALQGILFVLHPGSLVRLLATSRPEAVGRSCRYASISTRPP